MSRRLDEATRNQIVELRKLDPRAWTYTKISRELNVRRDQVAAALREAGLLGGGNVATTPPPANPPGGIHPAEAPATPASATRQPDPPRVGGIEEFLPMAEKQKPKDPHTETAADAEQGDPKGEQPVDYECPSCHVVITATGGRPDVCPNEECGVEFA